MGIVIFAVAVLVMAGGAVAVRLVGQQLANPTGEAWYDHAPDLCEVVDLEPVYQVYPWGSAEPVSSRADGSGRITTSSCRFTLKTPPEADRSMFGFLSVHVIIYRQVDEGKRRFESDVDEQTAPILDVDGPWYSAVMGLGSFLRPDDDELLAILWVLDGNLRVEINLSAESTTGASEEQVATAAQQIAAGVLQQLVQEPA